LSGRIGFNLYVLRLRSLKLKKIGYNYDYEFENKVESLKAEI